MTKAIEWILKLLSIRSKRAKAKNQRVVEYIDQCLEHIKTIMHFENHDESKIDYSHKWLKQAYYDLLKVVEDLVTPQECDILRQSLMAGRIYYHAKKYGQVSDVQIQREYDERFHRYVSNFYSQNDFRQNSYESVLRDLVIDGVVISDNDRADTLNKIRKLCMEDIARIDSMKEQIKSRQVFIVTA